MKAKKVLSGALAAILLTLIPGVAVCAEEMAGQEQTENTQVLSAQEQENQEKAASYVRYRCIFRGQYFFFAVG